MNIESVAILKLNDDLTLTLEIDFNEIAEKQEQYIDNQPSLTYKKPDNIVIKIGVPADARIYGIPVKWEFF